MGRSRPKYGSARRDTERMEDALDLSAASRSTHVSTGSLPPSELVQAAVAEAYERYRTNADGAVSDVYPALSRMVTVSSGKGGLGTFAPPLDATGNSVKGGLVAAFLSRRLGLDLFASEPTGRRDT